MTILPVLLGTLKHEVFWLTSSNDICVTTLWTHKAVDPIPQSRVDNEQAAIKAWLTASWRPIAVDTVRATLLKAWDMGTVPPTKFVDHPITPAIVGSGANTDSLPHSVGVVISLRTEAVGSGVRGRNGRIFHMGLRRSYLQNAFPDFTGGTEFDGILAAYNTLLTALKTATDAARGNWSIVGRQLDGVPNFDVIPIDHLIGVHNVSVQRRRRPRQPSYAIGS